MFDLRSLWKNKWWAYITIEPSYALFWFAEYQCNFYQENIILQKACRINATSEPDLNTPCDDEKQGIAFVAFVNSWIHLLTSILLTLLCAAFIKWSDRAGNQRKFILVWPTIGLNVMVLSSCLHTYFWSWNPLYYVICYEICQLVTGGPILYYFAAILYISDISSPRSRTARLGVLATMQYVCLPVGNVFSGFVLKRLGFLRSNLLSFVFTSVSLLLCVTLVKDISKPAEKKKGSFWKSLAAFNVTSAVNVMLKRRRNNKRFVLNLLLFTKVFVLFSRAAHEHSAFSFSNLFLQKSCRLDYTDEPDLHTPCDDPKRGIVYVALINAWLHPIGFILMHIISAFIINWSDLAGRQWKKIILLPVFGLVVETAVGCLHSYFWQWSPLSAALSYEFTQVFTSGRTLFYHASILYMSDTTNTENRTYRLSLLIILMHTCLPIGNVFSGIVLKEVGFFYSFVFGLFLSLLSLISGFVFIKDISVPAKRENKSICKQINPFKLKDAAKIFFKKRPNYKRLVLILVFFSDIMVVFTRMGEKSVLYLYMRHRFQWDERQYSFFDAYKNTGIIAGVLISMFVFSKCLKMHDIKIALFAGVCDTIAATCYIFANQNWHFFVICLIDMFHGAAFITAKSYTTKIVDSSELGNLTSVSALLSFISFLNKPLYNMVFKMNMDTFPNCFFLISVVVCMLSTISFGICYKFIKNYETIEAKEAVNENPDGGIKLDYRTD